MREGGEGNTPGNSEKIYELHCEKKGICSPQAVKYTLWEQFSSLLGFLCWTDVVDVKNFDFGTRTGVKLIHRWCSINFE